MSETSYFRSCLPLKLASVLPESSPDGTVSKRTYRWYRALRTLLHVSKRVREW